MQRVAIIGSGLIGRAWALIFARAGWQVAMSDPEPSVLAGLKEALAADCQILTRHGLCDDATAALQRISIAGSLAEAARDVDFVQENGPENVDIKTGIFAELDEVAPAGAILASSTSAIVASRFTSKLNGRGRCIVGHPVNPPHLIPLVELCGSEWTTPETMAGARDVYSSIGQVPVLVEKEIEGFVLNRLQGAVLSEAFRLVRDGVISAQDLDKTIKDGLGLRWSFMGPFETIDLNAPGGIADYCARYLGFYERLAGDPPGPDVFNKASVETVLASCPMPADPRRLEAASRWRNERLAALRAHKVLQNSKNPKQGEPDQ